MNKPAPPPKSRTAPPPASAPPPTAGSQPANVEGFQVSEGPKDGPQRIVIFGAGGGGKSTLASLIPGRNLFIDVEVGTRDLDVKRIDTVKTLPDVRAILQSSIVDEYDTIIIDSATKLEELAIAYTLANVPNDKGQRVTSVEGYGFGKGYQHVFESFLLLIADLDRLLEKGKNVVLICHECTNDVPNPAGEDFLRFEPHLQSPKSGKSSIRNRVVQWADHVLFLGYDVVAKDGKGKGGGTRTIHVQERPDHVAKSRRVFDPVPFNDPTDNTIWQYVFSANTNGGAA